MADATHQDFPSVLETHDVVAADGLGIAAVAVVASLVPGGVDRKRQCLNSCLAYASYTAYLHPPTDLPILAQDLLSK